MNLAERLIAAANGDVPWRKALLLDAASAIEAQRAETAQQGSVHESATAQPGCPNTSSNDSERQS